MAHGYCAMGWERKTHCVELIRKSLPLLSTGTWVIMSNHMSEDKTLSSVPRAGCHYLGISHATGTT